MLWIASGITALSLYLVYILHWPGPFRDLWEFLPDIAHQFDGQWSMDYLIEAYAGAHRLFFPKLVFFLDWYIFNGQNLLTLFISISCQLLYLYMILRALGSENNLDTAGKCLVASAFMASLFSTTQVNNFLYAMDVQWFMSNVLALLACRLLLTRQRIPLGFILSGVAAALCNFTGIMILLVGSLWWWITAHNTNRIAHNTNLITHSLATVFILLFAVLYVHNPQTSQHVLVTAMQSAPDTVYALKVLLASLIQMLWYASLYLSSPLSRLWPMAGAVLAWIVVGFCLYYWLRAWRQSLSNWQQLCLLLLTCIILNSLATSYGRLIYPNSATAERYQTLVLPLLPALAGLILPDAMHRGRSAIASLVLVSTLLALLLPAQWQAAREMGSLSNRVHLAHTAARSGLLALPYVSGTLSHPLLQQKLNMVEIMDPFLRERRLGYFLSPHIGQVGDAPPDILSLPDCNMMLIDKQARHTDGLQWVMALSADSPTLLQLQLVQSDRIIGFGQLLRQEGDLAPLSWQTGDARRLVAYTNHRMIDPRQPLQAIGLNGGQSVCQQRINTGTLQSK